MDERRVSVGVVCSLGVGPERGGRSSNQDNYLVCQDAGVRWRDGDREQILDAVARPEVLLAVADGMGGHEDGEIAAAAAVQALSRLYGRSVPREPEAELRQFLLETHQRVRERVAMGGEVKMGTTLTVVWIVEDRAYWAHVGDSRLYHWREGRLTRITRDQTREEFAMRDGRPIPTHPRYLAQNFIFGSRGLGDDASLRIDRGLDTGALTLRPGDRLLLSSDGLHGRLDDALLADTLENVPAPQACAVALAERAIAWQSDDNITALVARMEANIVEEVDDADTIIPV